MINEYRFGLAIIDGEKYENDIEVRWNGEILPLNFHKRHTIDIEEVKKAVEQNPETIIIGNGESGMAIVTEDVKNFIKEKGIELIIDKTEQAIKTFNVMKEDSLEEEGKQRKVIGFFHLTC
jgi:hypothetical protein